MFNLDVGLGMSFWWLVDNDVSVAAEEWAATLSKAGMDGSISSGKTATSMKFLRRRLLRLAQQ